MASKKLELQPLDPAITKAIYDISIAVQDLTPERQCRVIGAAAMMHGHYNEAIQFAHLAMREATKAAETAETTED